MARQTTLPVPGALLIVLATVCFSLMAWCVRLGHESFEPTTFVLARSLVQMLALLVFWRKVIPFEPAWKSIVRVHLLRGGVGVFSMWLLYFSLQHVSLALVSLLTTTSVFRAAVLGRYGLGESIARTDKIQSAFVLAGIVIALWPTSSPASWSFSFVGVLAALGCGASMGTAQALIRHLRASRGTLEIVFWFGVVGVLSTLPFFALSPQWPASPREVGLLVGTGLFALAGQLLLTAGFRDTPAFLGSLCLLTGIFWNALLGWLTLGEVPPWTFVLGAAASVVGTGALVVGQVSKR